MGKIFRWEKGRQFSGYFKMLLARGSFPFSWDMYLLKYPTGSEIPEHSDPVDGRRHFRLNIVLKPAKEGGKFHCEKSIIDWKFIKFFRPDLNKHSLSKVLKGSRYILSIGWALK